MITSMQKLECKVRAVNKANQYAQEISPILRDIFAPFVGQKIEKVDGSLLKKIKILVPEFKGVHFVYRHQSDYSLAYCVKTCETVVNPGQNTCDHCHYHETMVCFGNMKNGVLTEILPLYVAPPPADAQDIVKKREIYKQAKRAVDNAQLDLFPFGEYDV